MGRRAVVIVLDGLGAGKAPDAADFGDEGANTLANTAEATGGLQAPNLQSLGLGNVEEIRGVPPAETPAASHGLMIELSAAKATLAGHWEMMGLVLDDPGLRLRLGLAGSEAARARFDRRRLAEEWCRVYGDDGGELEAPGPSLG